MARHTLRVLLTVLCAFAGPESLRPGDHESEFPSELVNFVPFRGNPVFTAAKGQWDARIRERGWILREDGLYRLWYTGYDGTADGLRMLGYATSIDGIHWTRHPRNPLLKDVWVE